MNSKTTTGLGAIAVALTLAACSSSPAAPAAQPTTAAVVAVTTTPPAPAPAATTADPNRTADAALCAKFDTGTKYLAALTAQIATGALHPTEPPALTIGKADIAIRAAAAKAPAADATATGMIGFATDIEALSKKITSPDAKGAIHITDEWAAVKTDWAGIDARCGTAGYTLTNQIK